MAFFSVIVPIYKVDKYLRQCLDSILDQSFGDFELILVDDGSPDKSPEICDEYAHRDSRVKVIHKENGGVVAARSAGVNAASGDRLIFIDADDWAAEGLFEKLAGAIEKYRADIVCCGAVWAYEDRDEKMPFPAEPGFYDRERLEKEIFPGLIEDAQGRYFPPSLWAKAFRRDVYTKHQLESGRVSVAEDHACVKPCVYEAQSMYILNDCLYYYRQNPSSVTKNKRAFSLEGPGIVARHMEEHIPMDEGDFQLQVYRNYVHNLFNAAASQFNKDGDPAGIKADILSFIGDEYSERAIKNCSYSIKNWKGRFALFALRHRALYLMRLYNRMN